VRDLEILGGIPCFRGTRVPFQNLLDYLEAGETLDQFLEQFPTVTRLMAIEALENLPRPNNPPELVGCAPYRVEAGVPETYRGRLARCSRGVPPVHPHGRDGHARRHGGSETLPRQRAGRPRYNPFVPLSLKPHEVIQIG
jgi:uncharacterized protein (DUF433 family)